MNQSIHPGTTLGVLELKVSKLERSIPFYTEVIGMQLLSQQTSHADLTVDGTTAFLRLVEIPEASITPRKSTAGLYHLALLVPSRAALGLSLRRLMEFGIPVGQGDHLVSEALYISDPDHNGIEIYCDRPRSQWKKDANGHYIMTTDPVDIEGLLSEAGDLPWNGLPSDTLLGHVHLHVRDLASSKAFYSDILGFDIVLDASKTMGALFLSAGGYHHHIGMNIWAGIGAPEPQQNGTGLRYFTVQLPSQTELDLVRKRISHAGLSIQQLSEQGDLWGILDPSGIEVRLTIS